MPPAQPTVDLLETGQRLWDIFHGDQYLYCPKIEFGGAHWTPFGSDELPRYFTGDFSVINASCEGPQKTWKSCLSRAKYFVNEPTQNVLLIRRFLI